MVCPSCHSVRLQVLESRHDGDNTIRRRRECKRCQARFTTLERPKAAPHEPHRAGDSRVAPVRRRLHSAGVGEYARIVDERMREAEARARPPEPPPLPSWAEPLADLVPEKLKPVIRAELRKGRKS